jgi:hypothetical protein
MLIEKPLHGISQNQKRNQKQGQTTFRRDSQLGFSRAQP